MPELKKNDDNTNQEKLLKLQNMTRTRRYQASTVFSFLFLYRLVFTDDDVHLENVRWYDSNTVLVYLFYGCLVFCSYVYRKMFANKFYINKNLVVSVLSCRYVLLFFFLFLFLFYLYIFVTFI